MFNLGLTEDLQVYIPQHVENQNRPRRKTTMAAQKDLGEARSPLDLLVDPDVDFAGYDPYIVAITSGGQQDARSSGPSDTEQSPERRKVKLMAWLREHGA